MGKSFQIFICICLIVFLASCSATKGLEKGQQLYMGATIHLHKQSDSSKVVNDELSEELQGLLRPEPNSFAPKLWIYNWGGPSSKKGFFRNLFHKIGSPPVVTSYGAIEKNREILQNRLENRGYFRDTVTVDTTVKGKRLYVQFDAYLDSQYHIRNSVYQFDTVTALGKTASRLTRRWGARDKGQAYSLDQILGQRTRLDAWLKQRGFYYFNPDYLITLADTTIGSHQVDLTMKLKYSTPKDAKKQFRVNDIIVFADYTVGTDTTFKYINHDPSDSGYIIIDSAKIVKPIVFSRLLGFKKGDLYNLNNHNLALNRLTTLGMYKFVKLRFEETDTTQRPGYWLNAFYYLTPAQKKSIRFETSGYAKSNSANGGEMSLNWTNRNIFRGAEIFTARLYGGLEKQVNTGNYSGAIRRVGTELSLTLPRVLSPFQFHTNPDFLPQTVIKASYEFYTRTDQYTLNSLNLSYGYNWHQSQTKSHQLNVLSFTFVRPTNISPGFQLALDTNIVLFRSIERQFIIGSNYNYNYSSLNASGSARKKNNIYFNANFDVSGNLLGILTGANVNKGKEKTIFNSPFSQYIRGEFDFRDYLKLTRKTTLATRALFGLGYAWGNSTSMPFVKSFFVGGPNDVRAYSSRSLGPGGYYAGNPKNAVYFLGDQPGDMKIEMNAELRRNLFSIVDGALFVDAGNTWLVRNDPTRPGGKFSNQFYKQLAIGTGAGLRFNMNVLVLRIDVGLPMRGPDTESNDFQWKMKKWNWSWIQSNWIWNIAIGYPF
ncbi:BamA/TamA family outer membrane protein [Rhizosphaericola mali]|uniref:BamA/TamA family outer membrane protein n=1 Tax=Rhizosphaericola mali TaxID=2545455 RepID=A0A5P2G2S5_9BACT|nr:BamA/TamA family outer membrane protein [Rhizosphaericola mali]